MIPMLRVFSRLNLRGMLSFAVGAESRIGRLAGMKKGPGALITTRMSAAGVCLVGRRLHGLDSPRPGASTDERVRPEADTEYSRALRPQRAASGRPRGPARHPRRRLRTRALVGAALLLVAEFMPLFEVRTSARNSVVSDRPVGLASLLRAACRSRCWSPRWRWRGAGRRPARRPRPDRPGLVTLVIALARDLPDAQSSGIERPAARMSPPPPARGPGSTSRPPAG